jgi:hypothetical protein
MTTQSSNSQLSMTLEPSCSFAMQVIELYKSKQKRRYKYESLAHQLIEKLKNVPEPILEKAFNIYEKSTDKKDSSKLPYPSYYLGIVKRLLEESDRTNGQINVDKPKWGKSI